MKTIFIISVFFFSINAFSQSEDYSIIPMQAGSAKLVSGKATVTLNVNSISALSPQNGGESYYVELTPVGNCGPLKLEEKGDKSFTVTASGTGATTGNFDYIIFIKYHPVPFSQSVQPPIISPATGK